MKPRGISAAAVIALLLPAIGRAQVRDWREIQKPPLRAFSPQRPTRIALSNGLTHILPEEQADWLAPLIVGAVVMVFGFIAVLRGRSNVKPESLAPQRTMESLRRDADMMKQHATNVKDQAVTTMKEQTS